MAEKSTADQFTADRKSNILLFSTSTSSVNLSGKIPEQLDLVKEVHAKDQLMSDAPSREEVNAKLEAVEARLDTKLANISADLKVLLVKTDQSINAATEAKKAASNVKWNILFTALATLGVVVTVIIAFNSIGYTVLSLIKQSQETVIQSHAQQTTPPK